MGLDLLTQSNKLGDKNENNLAVCREWALYMSPKQSSGGEIALRSTAAAFWWGSCCCVGDHDGILRWRVTAVSRDQAYPAHYTGNKGRR